ncbi:MAG TPA: type II secretion system F family protein, partial [Candidatus Nanopelagicales bacterium]
MRGAPEPHIGELLSGLAAELAAGQPPGAALEAAARACRTDPCPRARAAARTGGDVAAALRQDAHAPGAEGLAALAACWEVAAHSGAGLEQAVRRLADGMRATREARAQLDAEVAAARASAKLLAALPLFGVALGQWLGADPLE